MRFLYSQNGCWSPASEHASEHEVINENCLVCKGKLDYFQFAQEMKCFECGIVEMGYVNCANGHYICEKCHGRKTLEVLIDKVWEMDDKNPFIMAESLIDNLELPMLGCEHAWVAAGAFIIALRNNGLDINKDQLEEVIIRTQKQAIGAYCGLTGICGIAPAIGAVYSVILGASCPKNQETSNTMHVVADVIKAIAYQAGPCCCKNFVYTALKIACDKSEVYIGIKLDTDCNIICKDSKRHPHGCRKEKCTYYGKEG